MKVLLYPIVFCMVCFILVTHSVGYAQNAPEKRKNNEKYVTADAIFFNLHEGDITETYYKSETLRRKDRSSKSTKNDEDIIQQSDGIASYLQELLFELEYIDTTGRFFPDYKNSLHLTMAVEELHFRHIKPSRKSPILRTYVEMVADFTLNSYYGKELYKNQLAKEVVIETNKETTWRDQMRSLIKELLYEFMLDNNVQSRTESSEYFDKESGQDNTVIRLSTSNTKGQMQEWREAVVTVLTKDGHGSGCVISQDGYMVTNYHVVQQEPTVRVKLHDGRVFDGTVLRKAPESDLALIKLEAKGLSFVTPGITKSELGLEVYTIGTPGDTLLTQTVSKGIISSRRSLDDSEYLQTDALINPGNSGGALLSTNGDLVGVVSAKYHGYGIEGIGFAVPSEKITEYLNVVFEKPAPSTPPPSKADPKPKKKGK